MKKSKYIDHTLLRQDARKEEILKLCEEAKEYDFASVCVNPTWVSFAKELLNGSGVDVCTVIGFPLGANSSKVKAYETEIAIADGATEIDMVINVGALKDKDYDKVYEDIKAVSTACNGTLLKVIIETCLLNDDEKVKVCELAVNAGANFVKTSTGFSTGGATKEDIALMRKTVGENIGVKASGGVRTPEDFEIMILNGATRIGTSAGVKLMQGESSTSNY
ncbi:MAG: deoxyribose-phosphate aldolase [Lachnospirales bacterium]